MIQGSWLSFFQDSCAFGYLSLLGGLKPQPWGGERHYLAVSPGACACHQVTFILCSPVWSVTITRPFDLTPQQPPFRQSLHTTILLCKALGWHSAAFAFVSSSLAMTLPPWSWCFSSHWLTAKMADLGSALPPVAANLPTSFQGRCLWFLNKWWMDLRQRDQFWN